MVVVFTSGGILKKQRHPPTASPQSYKPFNGFIQTLRAKNVFDGLSAIDQANVLTSIEHQFFERMNHNRMIGKRSNHSSKKKDFDTIAEKVLAKYAAADKVASHGQEFSEDQDCAIVQSINSTRYQIDLAKALVDIVYTNACSSQETLSPHAYEPFVWEVNPPPLSPSKLDE